MTRFLALLLLAAIATPLSAAERRFSVTSFDRIRVEAPFDVTLTTSKSPFAKAEGPVAALDIVDLRVEGRTLIVRQRSGADGAGRGVPMRLSLGTPSLRMATLTGGGRLSVDRMIGPAVTLALAGPGLLNVADIKTDRFDLLAAGSGSVTLKGTVKVGRMAVEGTTVLDAAGLQFDELTLIASGSSEVRAAPRRSVNITASGAATVVLEKPVACIQRVTGGATVSGCR